MTKTARDSLLFCLFRRRDKSFLLWSAPRSFDDGGFQFVVEKEIRINRDHFSLVCLFQCFSLPLWNHKPLGVVINEKRSGTKMTAGNSVFGKEATRTCGLFQIDNSHTFPSVEPLNIEDSSRMSDNTKRSGLFNVLHEQQLYVLWKPRRRKRCILFSYFFKRTFNLKMYKEKRPTGSLWRASSSHQFIDSEIFEVT